MVDDARKSWSEALKPWSGTDSLFGSEFFAFYGKLDWFAWTADDLDAAAAFHVELISRVATSRLGYNEGDELSALKSIHLLFEQARTLSLVSSSSGAFGILVWHTLNQHVRPFTAKWHRKSQQGALRALDATDIFRGELLIVQDRLRDLCCVLELACVGPRYRIEKCQTASQLAVTQEMERTVRWRPHGQNLSSNDQNPKQGEAALAEAEAALVSKRRTQTSPDREGWVAGLALSGGGIRSATFALGVLAALGRRNLLTQIDYLSTVSGGGYAGGFLTQLLCANEKNSEIGLKSSELPFKRHEGESLLLQKIRNNIAFLTSSKWERFTQLVAYAQGVFLNVLIITSIISVVAALVSSVGRFAVGLSEYLFVGLMPLALFFLLAPLLDRLYPALNQLKNWAAAIAAISAALIFLEVSHGMMESLSSTETFRSEWRVFFTAVLAAAAIVAVTRATISRSRFIKASATYVYAGLTAFVVFVFELAMYQSIMNLEGVSFWYIAIFVLITLAALTADVNKTSLHPFYKAKLSKAFLLRADGEPDLAIKLSQAGSIKAPFHIINCAVNLPGSKKAGMRGRMSDLFTFTPVSAGSNVINYQPISGWEAANPDLDLASAVALSGAAVSPQMGTGSKGYMGFWLTFLNLRLGAWLTKPRESTRPWHNIRNLLQEFFGGADEKDKRVYISDGGHIENLGIYELLRRRCRFIVAVDGENDFQMTFHGLTNLQRLAYIDHGITIDIDLQDLRLGLEGVSRSHFQFCRIRYPAADTGREEIGYLLYLKLSLTGNEGEFIRRLKHDEPEFPHHSTANQFFTETQYEAYRNLGEHIADKMFLKALTGFDDSSEVCLEAWFKGLGQAFLDASKPQSTGPL
ncbi:hypothetical protein DSM25558_3929 [Agrobacterium sp. DSM 25558]|uniref:patatin-like phospholipase family protein n=1 Tax=Agrobacterium sp. DSM 25558 TaxID=1907665 RepID=UPI0009724CCB|nr:patatin-like phospholipase family protein [Agrobacterium sp. DSM 25558]SCX26096.1 hypothetical protein DSM25558_3929 [Agrobacterium sp. DSM 25558]